MGGGRVEQTINAKAADKLKRALEIRAVRVAVGGGSGAGNILPETLGVKRA